MSVCSRAAAPLLVVGALACGLPDVGEPSVKSQSPIVDVSPLSLAEAESSWGGAYLAGFHPRESNRAETWHWTTGSASIGFRNPRSDALLHLTMQGRPQRFETPQNVTVLAGGNVVEAFAATSRRVVTRTVALRRDLMGGSDSFTVELRIDKTLVPASVPGSSSGDTRELGIRVLSATIEPSILVRPPRGLLATRETTETGQDYRWTRRRVLLFGIPGARHFAVQLRRATGLCQGVRVALNGQVVDHAILEDESWLRLEYEAPPSSDGTSRAELLIEPGWQADGDSLSRGLMVGDYMWR